MLLSDADSCMNGGGVSVMRMGGTEEVLPPTSPVNSETPPPENSNTPPPENNGHDNNFSEGKEYF